MLGTITARWSKGRGHVRDRVDTATMMMAVITVSMMRGRKRACSRVMARFGGSTHPLELKPVMNNFKFIDTCFEPGELLFELLARHGRGRLCARRGRGI